MVERALDMKHGQAEQILNGAADGIPERPSTPASDWQALAKHVRARREALRLPIDLSRRGGPAEMTVRRIEAGTTDSIRPRTKDLLEQVLEWPRGMIDRILEGSGEDIEGRPGSAGRAQHLAEAIRTRRESLGLRQADLTARGGPSTETLRLIENAKQTEFGGLTLDRLDRAVAWPPGTSKRVLDGSVSDTELAKQADTAQQDWAALATAVRRKRELLGLRQSDLESRGGPSNGTVRNIEQAARTTYTSRTFSQLDTALRWRPGTARRILHGEVEDVAELGDDAPRPEHALTSTFSRDEGTYAILAVLGDLATQPARTATEAEALAVLKRLFDERTRR